MKTASPQAGGPREAASCRENEEAPHGGSGASRVPLWGEPAMGGGGPITIKSITPSGTLVG